MASTPFTCRFCGESGRHTTSEAGVPPASEPSVCDKAECRAKDAEEQQAAAVEEAESQKAAAEAVIDAAKPHRRKKDD